MTETPARLRRRYDELSTASGLFKDPDHPELRAAPLQQLWRQSLLASAMVMNGLYNAGRFFDFDAQMQWQTLKSGAILKLTGAKAERLMDARHIAVRG
jgi:hypothetical protein